MPSRAPGQMLSVEELRAELTKYGDRATVYAEAGRIRFFDHDEGGQELGSIETPDGLSKS